MPGLGFSGVANGAFTTTGKGSDVCGINAMSNSGAGVAGAGVISTFVTVTPPPPIGSAYEGGYFAGQISTAGNGIADYNLVVAPLSSGQTTTQWETSLGSGTPGTDSVIDGPTNSANMNNASHPAAQFCEGLTIGGYSNWYMPAKNELEICYYNLKPTTQGNNPYFPYGANTNAVPIHGNYTSGTPAQTSATDFKNTGSEAFAAVDYWCSTQFSSFTAWRQIFSDGSQVTSLKTNSFGVRAVRRVAV